WDFPPWATLNKFGPLNLAVHWIEVTDSGDGLAGVKLGEIISRNQVAYGFKVRIHAVTDPRDTLREAYLAGRLRIRQTIFLAVHLSGIQDGRRLNAFLLTEQGRVGAAVNREEYNRALRDWEQRRVRLAPDDGIDDILRANPDTVEGSYARW